MEPLRERVRKRERERSRNENPIFSCTFMFTSTSTFTWQASLALSKTQKEWKLPAHPSIEYRVIDGAIAQERRQGTGVDSSFEKPIYIVKLMSDRTSFLFRPNVLKEREEFAPATHKRPQGSLILSREKPFAEKIRGVRDHGLVVRFHVASAEIVLDALWKEVAGRARNHKAWQRLTPKCPRECVHKLVVFRAPDAMDEEVRAYPPQQEGNDTTSRREQEACGEWLTGSYHETAPSTVYDLP